MKQGAGDDKRDEAFGSHGEYSGCWEIAIYNSIAL